MAVLWILTEKGIECLQINLYQILPLNEITVWKRHQQKSNKAYGTKKKKELAFIRNYHKQKGLQSCRHMPSTRCRNRNMSLDTENRKPLILRSENNRTSGSETRGPITKIYNEGDLCPKTPIFESNAKKKNQKRIKLNLHIAEYSEKSKSITVISLYEHFMYILIGSVNDTSHRVTFLLARVSSQTFIDKKFLPIFCTTHIYLICQ